MNFNIIIDIVIKLLLIYSTQITILKILNIKKYFSKDKILGYIILLLLEPFVELINHKINFFCSTIFLIFIISCVSTGITKKNIGYNIFLTIISLAFSYVIYFIAIILSFFIDRIFVDFHSDIIKNR